MPSKPVIWTSVLLVVVGLVTEFIWALAVVSIERRWLVSCIALAIIAPYIQMATTAITTVDEPSWLGRFCRTSFLAVGAVSGIVVIAWLFW